MRGATQESDPYAAQTVWSDPLHRRAPHAELPADPRLLPDCLGGFVIHHAVARALGFGVPEAAEGDRDLRKVSKLLDAALARDPRPLAAQRSVAAYLYGTCHDFALIAASVLRAHGVPARLRVGFAGYFLSGKWEDHWVCECRTAEGWSLLDAQLGQRARAALGVDFPPDDVPRARFLTAPEMWRAIRSGRVDPAACGVSFAGIHGAWFAAASVLRDAAALAAVEALPWDYWGPARDFSRMHAVAEDWLAPLDALAAALEPAPDSKHAATALFDRFPWCRPTASVLSFVRDRPQEIALQ